MIKLHRLQTWLSTVPGQFTLACLAALTLFFTAEVYVQTGRNAVARPESSDFFKFYLSAERIRQGYSMYWLVPPKWQRGDPCHGDTPISQVHFALPQPSTMNLGGPLPCLGPNLNPPVVMLPIQAVSAMPSFKSAWWTWAAASVLSTIISAWLLAGSSLPGMRQRCLGTLWISAGLFAFYPTLANFSLGQVGTMMLLPVVLSWRALKVDQPLRAGAWLGLAVSVKPFLGLLLLGLLLTKEVRALVAALLTMAGLALLGGAVYGFDAYAHYIQVAGNVSWVATNWNGSWYGLFERYFIGQPGGSWPATRPWSQGLSSLCAVASAMCAGWLIFRAAKRDRAEANDALFAIGLPTALLVSPLGWVYYFPLLALSTCILIQRAQASSASRSIHLMLALAITMSAIPVSLQTTPTPLQPATWWGMDSWYWYTLLAWLLASTSAFTKRKQQ